MPNATGTDGRVSGTGQDTPKVCVPSCPAVPHCERIYQAGRVIMSRRPAQITQADVARIIRAAKQAGASEVVVKIGEQSVIVKLSTSRKEALEPDGEIVL